MLVKDLINKLKVFPADIDVQIMDADNVTYTSDFETYLQTCYQLDGTETLGVFLYETEKNQK